ncbi:MAG: J domain-containing protein [Elainellaceae cyanobacterium]
MRFDIKLGNAYANIPRPQIAEIIAEANTRIHQPSHTKLVIAISVVVGAIAAFLTQFWVGLIILAIGAGVAWKLEYDRRRNRTITLHYQFDNDIKVRFSTIQKACRILSQSEKIWLEATRKTVEDQKRNAGASHVINLSNTPVKIQCMQPPFIETNLNIWSLDVGILTLFFLPDYVLVWRRELYSSISYSALAISCDRQQINLSGTIPTDAKVVGKTWLHVTASGRPDPRAKHNPQLLQVQYGLLHILSSIGFSVRLHVSNISLAEQFTKTFNSVQQWLALRHKDAWSAKPRKEDTPDSDFIIDNRKSAYDVLGVKPTATLGEIRAAYRRMAQMNHPDKVVGLAPEFQLLAERRMKAITEAYRSLSQKAQTR